MFQDFMDELQFFLLVFNFDICGFDTYSTLVARISRIYRGLPVFKGTICLSILASVYWQMWMQTTELEGFITFILQMFK
jgi:hypothetical protein